MHAEPERQLAELEHSLPRPRYRALGRALGDLMVTPCLASLFRCALKPHKHELNGRQQEREQRPVRNNTCIRVRNAPSSIACLLEDCAVFLGPALAARCLRRLRSLPLWLKRLRVLVSRIAFRFHGRHQSRERMPWDRRCNLRLRPVRRECVLQASLP
jgi:hypothetical protein